jgi:protein tyrosine/serine phosphatase
MTSRYRRWRGTWADHFDRPVIRFVAWLDAMVNDHGLVRPLWNWPTKFATDAWRSNHPSPRQIRKLAKQGVQTIVNLRGLSAGGSSLYEIEACRTAGVDLVSLRMSSRGAPRRETLQEFEAIVHSVERPILFHCKSGADRSGFAAGLYLLLTGQGTVTDAKAQLSVRYLHFKSAKTGLLHEFFCEYERHCAHTPVTLQQWVAEVYDPRQLQQNFQPAGLTSWIVDKVLRRE